MTFRFATLITCLALGAQLQAATIIRVPSDQPTIQGAITAASNGDTVQVSAGTYFENLNFLGKAITVTSEQGSAVTIIDGKQLGPVVTFATGEGRQSVLNGFTVQHGKASGSANEGGGIRIANSAPTVTANVITNNTAANGGGGISISSGSPLIQGNTVQSNGQAAGFSGGVGGGGIAVIGAGSAQILNNNISNNSWNTSSGGGITLFAAGTPSIQNNLVSNNSAYSQGGGFYIVNQSDAAIVQNLIVGNTAANGGGVYWLVPSGPRGPFLINNTIVGNPSAQGSGVFADGFDAQAQLLNNIIVAATGQTAVMCGNFDSSVPQFRTNDVVSVSGASYGGICTNQTGLNGNISADPLFVNSGSGDYHLQGGSPAIDAGTNGGTPQADFDGVARPLDGNGDGVATVDIGIYEAPARDLIPPATQAVATPAPGASGWNTTNVSVNLSATDNASGSGVQSIRYSLNGGPMVVAGNPTTVTITAEGATTLNYAATDVAGNVEQARTLTIYIDKTAPISTAAATPAPIASGWNATAVTVNLNATDNAGGSGVQYIRYSLSGAQIGSGSITGNSTAVVITAEGTTNVSYGAIDTAGNVEQAKSLAIKIDETGPIISGMPAQGCTLSPAKHQLVQVATVTASDALSGLANLTVTASSNEPDSGTGGGDLPGDIVISGGTVSLRAERSPSGKGRIYTIVATATDLVGNKSTATAACSVPK